MKNEKVLILGMGPGWKEYPKDFDGEVWGLTKSLVVRSYVKSPVRWKWLVRYLSRNQKRLLWTNRTADEIRLRPRTLFEWILFERPQWKVEFEPAPERLDRMFAMDQIDNLKSILYMKVFTRGEYLRKINERNIPVVVPYAEPRITNYEVFPLKEAHQKLGPIYYTNSICFMIALAILKGFKTMELYGIVQGGRNEYVKERRGVEYWLGLAAGMGINIQIHAPTFLLTHNDGNLVYGYKKTPEQLVNELDL